MLSKTRLLQAQTFLKGRGRNSSDGSDKEALLFSRQMRGRQYVPSELLCFLSRRDIQKNIYFSDFSLFQKILKHHQSPNSQDSIGTRNIHQKARDKALQRISDFLGAFCTHNLISLREQFLNFRFQHMSTYITPSKLR